MAIGQVGGIPDADEPDACGLWRRLGVGRPPSDAATGLAAGPQARPLRAIADTGRARSRSAIRRAASPVRQRRTPGPQTYAARILDRHSERRRRHGSKVWRASRIRRLIFLRLSVTHR